MRLSVIIPSRNRASNLEQVVASLANQTLSKDEFEVIISDDNSNDGTSMVAWNYQNSLRLKYIFSNVPKLHSWNASVPRNLGALISDPSTTHFVFVDSDVVLPNTALQLYLEDIEKDPNRVIIGPYDFYKEGNEIIAVKDVRSLKFEEVDVDQTFETIHDGLACFGGNLVIPKDIFWSVRGFSVDTHIGLEDGDMGLKLWKKKVRFSYDKRNRGKHLWHKSPEDRFPPDMSQHINKLNLKHFGMNTPEVDKNMDLISASRDTYASWGITGWEPPAEWQQNKLDFSMKVNKEPTPEEKVAGWLDDEEGI